jgi:hypothetical protein
MRMTSNAAVALLGLLVASPLAAQAPERTQTLSFSPVLALFEIIVADYEFALGTETTLGAGVGYWHFEEDSNSEFPEDDAEASYLAFDLKGRFYPDRVFEGFELGASLGVARIGYNQDTTGQDATATGFSYGLEVGHAWLLGDERRWFLGTAIGAKRFWFDEDDDDLPTVMPTGRLNFGVAF